MLPQATADLYQANQLRFAALLKSLRSEWTLTPNGDWDAQWAQMRGRAVTLVTAAQIGAASDGAAMIPAALDETGAGLQQVGHVDPRRFAGVASDGRDIGTLLDQALIAARMAMGGGHRQVAAGFQFLSLAGHTQVVDASRAASATAIAATPGAGWVRMVNPPCCPDCAVLAGKWFRWNAGFERHPGCDCIHRPASEREAPAGYSQNIDPAQINGLSEGEREALANGADLNQVVNARRGADPQRMFTSEGTTRRGVAYRAIRQNHGAFAEAKKAGARYTSTTVGRLTPDAILRVAADRADAVRLLRTYGYIV